MDESGDPELTHVIKAKKKNYYGALSKSCFPRIESDSTPRRSLVYINIESLLALSR